MAEAERERWNAKYARMEPGPAEPSAVLVGLRDWLQPPGSALDLAGGAGASAVYLARLGFDLTLVDIAERGLEHAASRAAAAGVELTRVQADLERDPVPPGPWKLIVCSHYLQRGLPARAAAELEVGGRLIWIHPTRTNLERHAKPSARFLLEPGEAEAIAAATGLRLRVAEEGWVGEGAKARHLARIVAERRA